MFNKKILCVIPARGGSKGIKLKNIYIVNGKPLISYTLDFVKNLNFFNETIISTDHKKIKKAVEDFRQRKPSLLSIPVLVNLEAWLQSQS